MIDKHLTYLLEICVSCCICLFETPRFLVKKTNAIINYTNFI